MVREVSESCVESLLIEMVSSYCNRFYADKPELAARRIEAIGYQIGHQLCERYIFFRRMTPQFFSFKSSVSSTTVNLDLVLFSCGEPSVIQFSVTLSRFASDVLVASSDDQCSLEVDIFVCYRNLDLCF